MPMDTVTGDNSVVIADRVATCAHRSPQSTSNARGGIQTAPHEPPRGPVGTHGGSWGFHMFLDKRTFTETCDVTRTSHGRPADVRWMSSGRPTYVHGE